MKLTKDIINEIRLELESARYGEFEGIYQRYADKLGVVPNTIRRKFTYMDSKQKMDKPRQIKGISQLRNWIEESK